MTNRLLMSVAAVALIAGTGLANAQGAGMSRQAPSAGPASQSAPSADRAAPAEHAAPANRDEASDTSKRPDNGSDIKSSQSDDKVQRDNGDRANDASRDSARPQGSAQANDAKGGKDMKAEGRDSAPNAKSASDKSASDKAADSKSTTTTGQAGAGAKLSADQRTKITTTIKQQNIKPVTNINFSVSVGTRVPRDVGFHPLPAEIVTIYPDWRGYEFFLVRDEIIVVNPRTLEIVAVLDA